MIRQRFCFDLDYPGTCCDKKMCHTVQDDTLSIREILVRFGAGQPMPEIGMQPQYPENTPDIDDPIADVDWDDLVSVQEYLAKVENRCEELKKKRGDLASQLDSALNINQLNKEENGKENGKENGEG